MYSWLSAKVYGKRAQPGDKSHLLANGFEYYELLLFAVIGLPACLFFFSYTFLNQSVPVGAALEADSYASVDGAVCSIPELDILDILFRALLVKYAARSRLTH